MSTGLKPGHTTVQDALDYPQDPSWYPVFLQPPEGAIPPFPINTPSFRNAFFFVIGSETFSSLLEAEEGGGSWFTRERTDLMQAFWIELHEHYCRAER